MTDAGILLSNEYFQVPSGYLFLYRRYKGIDLVDKKTRVYFESALSSLKTKIDESRLVEYISQFLEEIDTEHYHTTGFGLLMRDHNYTGVFKLYPSVVNKTYRLCIDDKGAYLDPENWVTPSQWLLKINDLARSTIVCRYADSLEYLSERLVKKLQDIGFTSTFKRMSKTRGYYAYHVDVKIPVDYLDYGTGDVISDFASFEIQITTQLQEVLYDLTHSLYEDIRVHKVKLDNDWEWKLDSPLFKAAYISHTLHLLEADIVSLRKEKERVE